MIYLLGGGGEVNNLCKVHGHFDSAKFKRNKFIFVQITSVVIRLKDKML